MANRKKLETEAALWRQSLKEGRVLRIKEIPNCLDSYPTIAARDEAVERAKQAGLTPEILTFTE